MEFLPPGDKGEGVRTNQPERLSSIRADNGQLQLNAKGTNCGVWPSPPESILLTTSDMPAEAGEGREVPNRSRREPDYKRTDE